MFSLSFKRITSGGNFIPEIDGLRFVAILSVVLFHILGFITARDMNPYHDSINYSGLVYYISHGHNGVPLFFVVSGLILGLPFARHYLNKEPKVSLKKYFIRRLTRLEPPYIVAMTFFFFASVYITHSLGFSEAAKSYLSSLFYSHNILYGINVLPLINCVTWSLEVEVQFYLLAPALAMIFKITNAWMRRVILVILIIVFILAGNFVKLPFLSLWDYFEYFLLGFLLADLFISCKGVIVKSRLHSFFAFSCLMGLWIWDGFEITNPLLKSLWELFFICCIFVFYYQVIINKALPFFAKPVITSIGGMCYSIYLLHYPAISFAGNFIVKFLFSSYSFLNVGIYIIFLLGVILMSSAVFFLLVERPCMVKDWHKVLFSKIGYRKAID